MGKGLNTLIYLVVTIFIIVGVIALLSWILPYVLIVLVIFWAYRYIKNNMFKSRKHNNVNRYSTTYKEQEDYADGNVIDVDYEDVKK
ncbi:hypothetical protein [Clostridium sp. 'White wine YQ']|uniref:hypothetical protein n=1 Tax=Clostridium sp. 'White wine YQ' TaxID=3027474 RepID=UPI0023652E21|nr:hypothetical protein [Clostridium sp. 'White wine YQ']MDD7792914.1 hypothetical protein [Clostridium sp. 'White wine YQ']